MEHVKTFLDTSTIHGLSWISSSRRWSRIFWILTVIGGFTGAILLIHASFYNWNQNPILTTIKTLPISEITFPNVTVSPPQQAYLNLNYDIMEADKKEIGEATRKELLASALEVLQDISFEEVMTNLNKVQDPNRYNNWYHGITKVSVPYFYKDSDEIIYMIDTSSKSGNISTENFGQYFDANKVEKNIHIRIGLVLYYLDFIVFSIKKITMTGIDGVDELSFGNYWMGYDKIEASLKQVWKNVTGDDYKVELKRNLFMNDVNDVNLNLMPGFQLSWYSDPQATSDAEFINRNPMTDEFIRFANQIW